MATNSRTGKPMPEGRKFEKGNMAASVYKEEYADEMMKYALGGYDLLPTVEDFCRLTNLSTRTVERWCADPEKYPRLALSHARLLAEQKRVLIEKGLTEVFNVNMVKFLLTNNHGMSEKTTANIDAKTDNKFEVNIKVID